MKVSELEGEALDYWVARAEGHQVAKHTYSGGHHYTLYFASGDTPRLPAYSTDWSDGGPVMEKAAIGWRDRNPSAQVHAGAHKGLSSVEGQPWEAWFCDDGPEGGNVVHSHVQVGPTMLIAAMRAYVVSKFGEEVEDLA